MKKNFKFLTSVASMLLTSAVLLVCGMYAIGADYGDSKPYDNSDSLSDLSGLQNLDFIQTNQPAEADPPALTPQEDLHGKFEQYIHAEDNTATVFSDEEYAELKAIREKGERTPLTYDEVLFIINDSINLYHKYDKIILTNAVVDGISHNTYLSCNSEEIKTYHGDFSEFVNYNLAYRQYEKMLEDIYSIIHYRIYVHDAGFASVNDGTDGDKKIQLLSLNGGLSSGADNDAHLATEWQKIAYKRKWWSLNSIPPESLNLQPLTAPLLFTHHSSKSQRYQLYITSPDWKETKVFPTNELTELMPTVTSIYISGDSNDWGTNIVLNEGTGRLYFFTSKFSSYPLCGDYTESNGVLTYYVDNASGKSYSYVFLYEDDAWVYSREKSNPVGYSYEIKDGLRFTLLERNACTKKPVANIRITVDGAAEAIEPFFEDEVYVYSFPDVLSEYIIVTFTDGTEMTVKEALFKGYIDISELDKYSIKYIKDLKD